MEARGAGIPLVEITFESRVRDSEADLSSEDFCDIVSCCFAGANKLLFKGIFTDLRILADTGVVSPMVGGACRDLFSIEDPAIVLLLCWRSAMKVDGVLATEGIFLASFSGLDIRSSV